MRFTEFRTLSGDERAAIARIGLSEGWMVLTRYMDEQFDAQKAQWGHEVWAGTHDPVDAAERCGFWKGVKAVMGSPKAADETLQRDINKAKEAA